MDIKHVAIIMDGNGRWAKAQGKPRLFGHNAGMNALTEIVRHTDELNIKHLTVYAFSTENWKRPAEEVSGIFKLVVTYVNKELRELCEKNVKIDIIGDISKIPEDSKKSVIEAIESTKNNTGLTLHIALNYGGRDDILRALKSLAADVKCGNIDPETLSEEDISSRLYTKDVPDPDLIIRTGGEYRLSNFLTWQSAYSEIVVTPVYWPDFTPAELDKCLKEFESRDRRFGGIK